MAKLPLSIYLLKQDRVSAFEKDLHVNAQTVLPLAPPLDGYVLSLPVNQSFPDGSVFSTRCCKIRPPLTSHRSVSCRPYARSPRPRDLRSDFRPMRG